MTQSSSSFEQYNNVDDLIDDLPFHLRNKVLRQIDPIQRDSYRQRTITTKQLERVRAKRTKLLLWYSLSIGPAFVGTIVGLLLFIPIITIPVGIILIYASCWPLYRCALYHFRLRHSEDIQE